MIDVNRGPAPDFKIDVEAIEQAVAHHKPKILFLTSPNNPDGSILEERELSRLLRLPVLIVLDEAYVEFSSVYSSRIGEVPDRKNLIVLRTFSKRAGLAGASVTTSCVHNSLTFCRERRNQSRLRRFPYRANRLYLAREAAVQRVSDCRRGSNSCLVKPNIFAGMVACLKQKNDSCRYLTGSS